MCERGNASSRYNLVAGARFSTCGMGKNIGTTKNSPASSFGAAYTRSSLIKYLKNFVRTEASGKSFDKCYSPGILIVGDILLRDEQARIIFEEYVIDFTTPDELERRVARLGATAFEILATTRNTMNDGSFCPEFHGNSIRLFLSNHGRVLRFSRAMENKLG